MIKVCAIADEAQGLDPPVPAFQGTTCFLAYHLDQSISESYREQPKSHLIGLWTVQMTKAVLARFLFRKEKLIPAALKPLHINQRI